MIKRVWIAALLALGLSAPVGAQDIIRPSGGQLSKSGYVNFGSPTGTNGYGFRDYAGQIQFKNESGDWTSLTSLKTDNYWARSGANTTLGTGSDLVGIGVALPESKFHVNGDGSPTTMWGLAMFSATGGVSTAGNLYGIVVDKRGTASLAFGINKDSMSGYNIPANAAFISTADTPTTLTIGRGSGTGLPAYADLTIAGTTGFVGLKNTNPTVQLDIVGQGLANGNAISLSSFNATYSNYNGAPYIFLNKSHSDTVNTNLSTINGEILGYINWRGVDVANNSGAAIALYGTQSGNAGTGDWNIPATLSVEVGSPSGAVNTFNTAYDKTWVSPKLGIGTSSPSATLSVGNNLFTVDGTTGNTATVGTLTIGSTSRSASTEALNILVPTNPVAITGAATSSQGIHINSPEEKTYTGFPAPTGTNLVYPISSFNYNLGTSQTINTNYAQIYGTNLYLYFSTTSTPDLERFFITGQQSLILWDAKTTAKQILAGTATVQYRGVDANGRTTNTLNGGIGGNVSVVAQTNYTQTITNITGTSVSLLGASTATTNVTNIYGSISNFSTSGTATDFNSAVTNVYGFRATRGLNGTFTGGTRTVTNYYGLFVGSPSASGKYTFTNTYGVYIEDPAALSYFAGNLVGPGASMLGRSVEAVTTTKAPSTTLELDELYTNEGDADGATITLPTAAAGLTYTFYVQTGQTLTVTAASGDTIRVNGIVSAAAGSASSNVVGSYLVLVAVNATEWIAVSVGGSWTVV
jgi:hypothetical protein